MSGEAEGSIASMLACHRRCAQQALQLARLISHSHASAAASPSLQESPESASVETLRNRLAQGILHQLYSSISRHLTSGVDTLSQRQYLWTLPIPQGMLLGALLRGLHSVQDLPLRISSRLPAALSLAGIQWLHHIGRSVLSDLPCRSFFASLGADLWLEV